MLARMTKDEYVELVPYFPYEVVKVFCDNTIQVQGSPRRYDSNCFDLLHNSKKITPEEALKVFLQELEEAKQ